MKVAEVDRKPPWPASRLRLVVFRKGIWVAVAAALMAAACVDRPVEQDGGPIEGIARDDIFVLVMHVDRASYEASEPISAGAALTYVGPAPVIDARGSGSGPILFSIEQLDGPLDMGITATGDCATHPFVRDVAQTRQFVKSAAFDPEDPADAFWPAYLADPLLRLPAGKWRLTASVELAIGDCGDPWHRLEAAAEVMVQP